MPEFGANVSIGEELRNVMVKIWGKKCDERGWDIL